jgi:hypothetical protein
VALAAVADLVVTLLVRHDEHDVRSIHRSRHFASSEVRDDTRVTVGGRK